MDHFLKILKSQYQRMPWIVRFPVSWTYYFVRTVYDLLRPCAWLIRSRADENNGPVGLMFCGKVQDKNYVVRMVFPKIALKPSLGGFGFGILRRSLKSTGKILMF